MLSTNRCTRDVKRPDRNYSVNASDQSTILDRRSTIPSKPQVELGNRVTEVNVGYCVGGSSAINGMAVLQGSKRDYDIWAELGNKGSTWNWNGLLPYFRKVSPKMMNVCVDISCNLDHRPSTLYHPTQPWLPITT